MPKPSVTIFDITKLKPRGKAEKAEEPEVEESDDESGDPGLEAAFDELAAALESGDTTAGVNALKSFFEQCYSHEE